MKGVPLYISFPIASQTASTSQMKSSASTRRRRAYSTSLSLSSSSSRWVSCKSTDGQQAPVVIRPPRPPKRLGSSLSMDTASTEDQQDQAAASQDASPKIPRRSWTMLSDGPLLPTSIDAKENQEEQAVLSRRHSEPTLTRSVAAAIAA